VVAAKAVRAPSQKRGEKDGNTQRNHARTEDGEAEAHEDNVLGEIHGAEPLGSNASLRHVSPPSSGGTDLAARLRDAAQGEDVGFTTGHFPIQKCLSWALLLAFSHHSFPHSRNAGQISGTQIEQHRSGLVACEPVQARLPALQDGFRCGNS
jgi:hypothetical protein